LALRRVAANLLEVGAALRFIRAHRRMSPSVSDVMREVPALRRSLEGRWRRVLHRGVADAIRRVHLERAKDLMLTQQPKD
jgi:LacI family transcriptional regulator